MRKGICCFFTVAAFVVGGHTASAQRTISGQGSFAFSALVGGTSVGAEAFFQQYTPGGFWEVGATGMVRRTPLSFPVGNGRMASTLLAAENRMTESAQEVAGGLMPGAGQEVTGGLVLESVQVVAGGGFQWRLAATRNRVLCWYAGAGAFAGVEWMDPFRHLPDYVELGVEEFRFLYGVYAGTTLELFLGRRLALLVRGGLPVNFSAVTGHVHWQAGLGLKILFD